MTNKIISLAKPIEKKELSYEELIKKHLDELTDDQKTSIPKVLFVGGVNDDASTYQILAGDNLFEVIGVLSLLQQFMTIDNLGG